RAPGRRPARRLPRARWRAHRAARLREPAGAAPAPAGDERARSHAPLLPGRRPGRHPRRAPRRRRARARGDGDPLPRVPVRGLLHRRSRRAADRAGAGAGRSGGAAAGRVSLRPATRAESLPGEAPWVWGMTRYQWLVLFAAWLGWGFDVFDGLLFNLVAPVCLPRLLGVAAGDARVGAATGAITAVLLVGWATGGILFGLATDRLGRSRTLLLTMLVYATATAACAFATDVWVLAAFRFVAALGIGGEWAAGASLVAEVVPGRRRVAAGALLYTSSPLGIFLAPPRARARGVGARGAPGPASGGAVRPGAPPRHLRRARHVHRDAGRLVGDERLPAPGGGVPRRAGRRAERARGLHHLREHHVQPG